ncbi:MAG TPA: hypothetical protein PLD25_21025 [Chloroflexota bacterium]|nr:hypothetical protein [Chloroflexota bacterium]HUM67975.1 hypothetical protein [Chloroflexota bacterium]
MLKTRLRMIGALIFVGLSLLFYISSQSFAQSDTSSELVTWTCSGAPCPWGNSLNGQALVWPATLEPLSNRLGYTVSAGIYLPESTATGITVTILSGAAAIYAGLPDAESHRLLTTLSPGQSSVITGLAPGEVVSVQSSQGPFIYTLEVPGVDPTLTPTPSPSSTPTATATLPAESDASQLVTWTCTGSPCPWGSPLSGQALVWPDSLGATNSRLGYTVSAGIYLPESAATGMTIAITSGAAAIYAGLPDAQSHWLVATLSAGQSVVITGLAAGEVISVQGSQGVFVYTLTMPDPSPTPTPTNTPSVTPTATATEPVPPDTSQVVTWTCTGSPCPWGSPLSGQALVWPDSLGAVNNRLGYTVSAGIYLPESAATGMTIAITSGVAAIYAGLPDAESHRLLATLSAGQSQILVGLVSGEVVSVQSHQGVFTYALTTGDPMPTATPGACVDPTTCAPVSAIQSYWRCNIDGCTDPDWVSAVIAWPSWSAFESNARAGNQSRTVYSFAGEMLYPYMGAWADGCHVTAVSGTVLIIEWQRGTEVWRETYLEPGESHTIDLVHPEDNAMIEGPDYSPGFSVTLENCVPQVIDKTVTPTPTPPPTSTPEPPGTPIPDIGFPSTAVVDDFNRADESLGNNWSGDVTDYTIVANQLTVGAGEDIYWSATTYGVNQEVYITLAAIDTSAAEINLVLKSQSSGVYSPGQIAVVYDPVNNRVQVWTYHLGQGWVQRGADIPVTFTNGDQFGARAWENGQVELFRNGVLLAVRDVTDWPYYSGGGHIGLFMVNANATVLDDFGGGSVELPQP